MTTIHFVGLIVTTMLSATTTPTAPPPGAQLIIGRFPGTVPPHLRIIAYPPASRDPASDWKKDGSYTTDLGEVYDYVTLNIERVEITGPTQPFDNQLGKMPHLTCCCTPFNNGFEPQWGNPNVSPNSAFLTFKNGTYISWPPDPKSSDAVTTFLLIDDNVNITFTGKLAASPDKKLIIKPGFDLVVANEPQCVLQGKKNCPHMTGDPDFWNYYRMGKGTQGCTATPLSGPCAPGTASCPTAGAAAAVSKPPKLAAKYRSRLTRGTAMYVDGVCSSSQWP